MSFFQYHPSGFWTKNTKITTSIQILRNIETFLVSLTWIFSIPAIWTLICHYVRQEGSCCQYGILTNGELCLPRECRGNLHQQLSCRDANHNVFTLLCLGDSDCDIWSCLWRKYILSPNNADSKRSERFWFHQVVTKQWTESGIYDWCYVMTFV